MTVNEERQTCDTGLTTVMPRFGLQGSHDFDSAVDGVLVAVARARASTDLGDVVCALANSVLGLSTVYGAVRDRADPAHALEYEDVRRHLVRVAELASDIGRTDITAVPEVPELLAGVLEVFSRLGVDRLPLSVLRAVLDPTSGSGARKLRKQLAAHGVMPRADMLVRPACKSYHLVDVERAAGLLPSSARAPRLLAEIHAVFVEEGLPAINQAALKVVLQQTRPALLPLSDNDLRDLLKPYGISSVRRRRQMMLRRLEVRRALRRCDLTEP